MKIRKNSPDAIGELLDGGWLLRDLAAAWGVSHTSVRHYRDFIQIPRYEVAKRIADTFGSEWTAGEVIDYIGRGRMRE